MTKSDILDLIDALRAEVESMDEPPMTPPGDCVPMQPIILTDSGVIRFRPNALVVHLLRFAEKHGCDMNTLATVWCPQEDRAQFAQLIGYSVSGYGDLSYALGVAEADEAAALLTPS